MPYCPECGAEYRKGFVECTDCGVDLVEDEEEDLLVEDDEIADDDESEQDEDEEAKDELLEIYSGPPYAATIVANALKERGVAAVVRAEADGGYGVPLESGVYISETDYNQHDDIVQECLEMVEVEPNQGSLFENEEE